MRIYKNKDWLYQKYWTEELSTIEIAKICDVSKETILKQLRKNQINVRTLSEAKKLWVRKHPDWQNPFKGLTRDKNYSWKGGRIKHSAGYICIHQPEHPRASRGYIYEHRFIMEKQMDRYLHPWETVHHINGIKDDNRIENLKLLPGNEHNTKIQKIYKENQGLKSLIYYLLITSRGISLLD